MAIDVNTILAADPSAPAPTPAVPTPLDQPAEPEFGSIDPMAALETLPADVLDIPAIYNVAKGSPPALSADDKLSDPAVQAIQKNAQALVAAGFGLYESRDGKKWVLYNSALMQPGDLLDADVRGELLNAAPDFKSAGGAQKLAPTEGPSPVGAAPANPAPLPASSQDKITTQRKQNLTPGSPTSGAQPGAGRILNNILKSAV